MELDWLSGVVSEANQLAAQGSNRLNVLHVNAHGTSLGDSTLDKVKRCTDRGPLRRRFCRLRHHRRAGRMFCVRHVGGSIAADAPQLGRTWASRWPCGHTNFEATSASGTSSGNISMLTTCWCEQVRQRSVTDFAPSQRMSPTLGEGAGLFCSRMLASVIGGTIDQTGIWAQARLYAARLSTHSRVASRRSGSSAGE